MNMRNNYRMSLTLLVYKNQTSSQAICEYLNKKYDIDIVEINDINQTKNYISIVIIHRDTPNMMKLVDLSDKRLIFVTKREHSGIPHKTASVGFSEYLFCEAYDYFMPTYSLRAFPKKVLTPKIGYYTKMIGSDTDKALYKEYLTKFNIPSVNLMELKDTKLFFEQITHFMYLYCTEFDGMPNTLCEAVNSNKQIIIPNQKIKRDGGFDFASNTNFHLDYNDTILDNSNNIFLEKNFEKVYQAMIESDFRLCFDRNRHYNIRNFLNEL